jgi:hypothetical protein
MTTPTTGSAVKTLRPLFTWALLAYVAAYLVFAFLSWIVPSPHETFTSAAYFAGFTDLYPIVLPLLAILIATQMDSVLPGAKLMAGIALIEYAVALFFGVITFLIGLGYAFTGIDHFSDVIGAMRHLIIGLLELGLLALAGFAVLRVFTALGGKLPEVSGFGSSSTPRHGTPPPSAE